VRPLEDEGRFAEKYDSSVVTELKLGDHEGECGSLDPEVELELVDDLAESVEEVEAERATVG
jgi:hypothetical protein